MAEITQKLNQSTRAHADAIADLTARLTAATDERTSVEVILRNTQESLHTVREEREKIATELAVMTTRCELLERTEGDARLRVSSLETQVGLLEKRCERYAARRAYHATDCYPLSVPLPC